MDGRPFFVGVAALLVGAERRVGIRSFELLAANGRYSEMWALQQSAE